MPRSNLFDPEWAHGDLAFSLERISNLRGAFACQFSVQVIASKLNVIGPPQAHLCLGFMIVEFEQNPFTEVACAAFEVGVRT